MSPPLSKITVAMLRTVGPGDVVELDQPLLPGVITLAPELHCLTADATLGRWSFEVRFLGILMGEVQANRATRRAAAVTWVSV